MICPGERELSRAFSAGASPELDAHRRGCARCGASWAALEQVVALARAAPVAELDRAAREELRVAILASVPERARRRRRPWVIAAAAAAGVAAAAVPGARLVGARADVPLLAGLLHGTVRAMPGPRVTRLGVMPDEVVRLVDGAIAVEVAPLGPGERFRVVVGDAQVEVRGTAFQVIATDDHLGSVSVLRGKVEVRPVDRPAVTLGDGDSWTAPAPRAAGETRVTPSPSPSPSPKARVSAKPIATRTPPPPPSPPPSPSPSPSAGPSPAVAGVGGSLSRAPDTRDPSPAEIAFAAGLTALRADRPAEAASSFARAADLGEPGLAEDAAFWNAVALGRSGQPLEARAAFASFLLAHPASPHVGEASVALGWLELDSGHVDEAAARFRAALADPSARIRASAERGLEAVARRQ